MTADNPIAPTTSAPVVAIIPAHNEERFIGSVVLRARRFADIVIVVDDGSTDATAEIAAAAGARVQRHEYNRGKGAALNTGFVDARTLLPRAVVVLDGDGQHHPQEIPTLLGPIVSGEADMVVGSRFMGRKSRIGWMRSLGMHGLTLVSNVGSGVHLSDSQTGFRAFSPRALEGMVLKATGFSAESEMQFVAGQLGLRVTEVPISVGYADRAKRSMWSQGLEVLNGILRLIGQNRPLLFFGAPGLFALLWGLWWGYRVVVIYRVSQQLAVGYALIAVLLSIAGSLALSTGIMLHSLRGLLLELLKDR